MTPIPSSRATNAATKDESRTLTGLRVLLLWSGRVLAAVRWLHDKAGRRLRLLRFSGLPKTDGWAACYNELYRSLGERALQTGRPGERMPELILHNIEGDHQQLSLCWDKKTALLVTMSLTCGQSRRHARALRWLSRRFEQSINTVVIYVKESHPINA